MFSGTVGRQCISIDLSAFDGESDFRLKFEIINDFGNNIVLDNVQLSGVCVPALSIGEDLAAKWDFRMFPNPAQGMVNLSLANLTTQRLQVEVFSTQGQLMFRETHPVGNGKWRDAIDLHQLPAGLYLVQITSGQEKLSRKLWIR